MKYMKIIITAVILSVLMSITSMVFFHHSEIVRFVKKRIEKPISTKEHLPLQMLKEGGYVIFMRHTSRDRPWVNGVIEIENITLLDLKGKCASGSQLNHQGHLEVEAIKRTITTHNIPIGEIYASPTCRTQQMAKAMFGDNYTTTDALYYTFLRDPHRHKYYNEAFRSLITTPPPQGTNRLLISHNRLLDKKVVNFTLSLKQGGTAIFKPVENKNGNLKLNFLGVIPKGSWISD